MKLKIEKQIQKKKNLIYKMKREDYKIYKMISVKESNSFKHQQKEKRDLYRVKNNYYKI